MHQKVCKCLLLSPFIAVQDEVGTAGRLEFPAGFWEDAGSPNGETLPCETGMLGAMVCTVICMKHTMLWRRQKVYQFSAAVQDEGGTAGRLEFPAGFWEAAGGPEGDATSVVWRVAASLHRLPLLREALVRIPVSVCEGRTMTMTLSCHLVGIHTSLVQAPTRHKH